MSDTEIGSVPAEVVLVAPNAAILAGRSKWQYRGAVRPDFAQHCARGQESVWDYPRPPRLEVMACLVEVRWQDALVASTRRAVRVCETAGAPTWYVHPDDVSTNLLSYDGGQSVCEWKGVAQGFSVGDVADAGWRYTQMFEEFAQLYLWCAFYPGKLECFVDGERVRPQPGGYYGGWVTENLAGPIKGEPGSGGW